jgi:phage terminase large subunit-like protein
VKAKAQTRGERNCAWIETCCNIPEGRDVGKPMRLRDWQRHEICRIYDNPHGTRRAILTFGRKNGKTALAAFLTLLHLCGPEAKPNSQLYSAAQSREQAAVLFALAAKVVRRSPVLSPVVGVRDTAKQLHCPELGTLYRALSAEASTAYGLSPVLIVHDELGQVNGPRSELYEALETATGAQDAPLSIIISTQAPTDADLLSVLIDDALKGGDDRVVVSLYTAPMDADPFDEASIRAANPAFGDFQNPVETLAMAEDARRMPSREAEYRNLILNQRVDMNAPFVSRIVWQECGGPIIGDWRDVPVFGGLDLSEVSDLTALVLVTPVDSVWHVKPTFWLPGDGLAEKARSDRVPYDLWADQGWLETTPGRTIEYEYIAGHLWRLSQTADLQKIAFDRWNFRHLQPWLGQGRFRSRNSSKATTRYSSRWGKAFKACRPRCAIWKARHLVGALVSRWAPGFDDVRKRTRCFKRDPLAIGSWRRTRAGEGSTEWLLLQWLCRLRGRGRAALMKCRFGRLSR